MKRIAVMALGAGMLLLSGCYVSSHKNGKSDNVDIGTPFGSVGVKTNDNVNTAALGLTPYPGSTPLKDKDNDSADVNLNFGSFHMGVKAASYTTGDSQDKVLAFYRNDLKRYGDVIECRNHMPVGKPERTSQGLSCVDEGESHNVHTGTEGDLQLKAGSPQREHIVALDARAGGTKIGLVALDLPVQMHQHGDNDSE